MYVPPENSPVYNNDNSYGNGIDILASKLTLIESDLGDVHFIVAGDLNARVGDIQDFIENDTVNYVFGADVEYPSDHHNREETVTLRSISLVFP